MVLVDTSVWIDHLRRGSQELTDFLNNAQVAIHPFIIGELACGNLRERKQILDLLTNLPETKQATHEEVLYFIEQNKLMGRGIGYVDAHLLASTALTNATTLWTLDKRLAQLAKTLLPGTK